MSDPFIGQITMFGGNFAPRGWAFCNGQLLNIASNTALFSILGTTYGGDGETTFALPDLRGRAPVHSGGGSAGPGRTPRPLGSNGGTETNTLSVGQLPAHTHDAPAAADRNTNRPNGAAPAPGGHYGAADAAANAAATRSTGTGQPVNNMQPFLAINYIIALQGIYPSS